mgnify:CR=1 FL=1
MIIWINGVRGIGKSTISEEIAKKIKGENVELLHSDEYYRRMLSDDMNLALGTGTHPYDNKYFSDYFRKQIEKSLKQGKKVIVDMTLINYRDGFNKYQLDILKELKNKGIIFSLVTGRSVSFFKLFPELLEFVDYIISSNGGAIFDVRNNKFLYNVCIKDNSFKKLIEYGIENNFTFVINELDKVYKYGNLKKIDSMDFDINRQYFSEQIVFYVKNVKINNIMKTIESVDSVVVNNVNKKDDRYSFDVNDISVSKGNSLLWLWDYLDIESSEVIAFGDGENDISMFKVAGLSVAVDNASDDIKSKVDCITLSNDEDGVAVFLETLI